MFIAYIKRIRRTGRAGSRDVIFNSLHDDPLLQGPALAREASSWRAVHSDWRIRLGLGRANNDGELTATTKHRC